MFKKIIRTIHYLRVYFLVFITLAFFYCLGLQPVDLSKFVGAKVSRAVGMSVSIPENPFNRLAAQLTEKENRLTQKENDLQQKESALQSGTMTFQFRLIVGMAIGIVVLFILILLNFYFDYRRRRRSNLAAGLRS